MARSSRAGRFTPAPPDTDGPYLLAQPTCADPGAEVTVFGYGFPAEGRGTLSFLPAEPEGISLRLSDVEVGADGTFQATVEVPDRPNDEPSTVRASITPGG